MPLPLPASIVLAAASILLIFGRRSSVIGIRLIGGCSLFSLFFAAISLLYERPLPFPAADSTTLPMLAWGVDALGTAEQWLVLLYAILAGTTIFDSIRRGQSAPVALGFFLFVVGGMLLCVQANDLLTLGLCVEIIELSGRAFRRQTCTMSDREESEPDASLASRLTWLVRGWMWLGIALLANATASTNFDVIRRILTNAYISGENPLHIGSPSRLMLISTGLIVVSLFVRMIFSVFQTFVHLDAEKQPTSLPALLAIGQQLVITAVLTRLIGNVLTGLSHSLITLLMAATFVNFAASCLFVFRGQTAGAKSLLRLVSAVGLLQTGWFVITLMVAATELDNHDVRFGAFHNQSETLAVIVLTQCSWLLASFTLVSVLASFQRGSRELQFIEDVKGLWTHAPLATLMLTVAIGSLIGFPLTAGFWSRWMTFLAGSHVHWKSTSMILTPFEGLRLAIFLGIVATIVNANLVTKLIRELFLETALGRPHACGGKLSFATAVMAASLCLTIGIAPQCVLIPLRAIRPPTSMQLDRPHTGSGSTPVGTLDSTPWSIGQANQPITTPTNSREYHWHTIPQAGLAAHYASKSSSSSKFEYSPRAPASRIARPAEIERTSGARGSSFASNSQQQ